MHSEADQPLKKSPDQTVADAIVAKLLNEALITKLELAELLCCPSNGDLPDRDKTGECWETRSKLVKLYPLRTPSNA